VARVQQESTRRLPQVQPATGLPCAMVLTVSFVLSLGTGLSCPHHPQAFVTPRELDASVGAPGPHDFAVRADDARLAPPARPSHPASTFVTTRTPLCFEAGYVGINNDFQKMSNDFFSRGQNTASAVDSPLEFLFFGRKDSVHLSRSWPKRRSIIVRIGRITGGRGRWNVTGQGVDS
jgi:hypothetical protein